MGLASFRGTSTKAPVPALGRRILVVEDDADCLEAMSELLESWGHTVSVACNGSDAVRLARTIRADIVVLDLTLPDWDACDVIRSVKAEDEAVTVVVFSGARESERAARTAGADWFVLKPDSETLQHVLGVLQRAR